MKIIILGAGLVGGPMAVDLAKDQDLSVTSVDNNQAALNRLKNYPINTINTNLADTGSLRELVADFDYVISAVPGFMGYSTLKTVIEAGKNVVDIAFFSQDPFLLDQLAKEKQVTAVVDCGVGPGMSNILAGYVDNILDITEKIEIYVGGLPRIREWPYEYKVVFSPLDVIEEYLRPARYIENGNLVTRPALSDPEYMNFKDLGTLEAFNTDGLRTLAKTLKAPFMKEKTLRYPGHIEKIAVLRDTGFFDQKEIEVNGKRIKPLDVTAKLLFPKWRLAEGDEDITVMKVIIEGVKDGRNTRYVYDLFDEYDRVSGTHSMARTTGYTATVVMRLLKEGLYRRKGIIAPEFIGQHPQCMEFILKKLKDRGVVFTSTIE